MPFQLYNAFIEFNTFYDQRSTFENLSLSACIGTMLCLSAMNLFWYRLILIKICAFVCEEDDYNSVRLEND